MHDELLKLWTAINSKKKEEWDLMGTDQERWEFHRGRWSGLVEAQRILFERMYELEQEAVSQ